nr:IS66 family transposase [Sphingobium cloacae]BAI43695.1 IS66 family transposase [Sphingomonas sp. NP5]
MDAALALPTSLEASHALIIKMAQEAAERERCLAEAQAAKAALEDELAAAKDEIRRVTDILDAFKRHRFGSRSERLSPDQYSLVLEELETTLGRAEAGLEAVAEKIGKTAAKPRRKKNLGHLSPHLPRVEQLIDIEDKACPCCGGDLHVIDEDVAERLDVVPVQLRVLVTRRPLYGCRACDKEGSGPVVQAKAPPFIVKAGLPTNALVAHVVVSKFSDHTPLHRQERILQRQGIHIDRSTLADWVGHAAWHVERLHRHLMAELKSSVRLFADETRMPVQAPGTGKTTSGQLWTYARDDSPWGGTAPPAVVYIYERDRKGCRPVEHLSGYRGWLQVDGYAGYNQVGQGNAVTLALCLSHCRRRFYDLAEKEPVAAEVLRRFALIYRIEASLRGKSPEERLAGRQALMKDEVDKLFAYLTANRRRFSAKSKMGEAIAYGLNHQAGLTRFLEDGRLELDTNIVERAIKPQALTRRNALFCATHEGAAHWAVLASLLHTAHINNVDPLAWLTHALDTLARDGDSADLAALMPWHFPKIEGR